MGNILATSKSIRDLVNRRGIQVFDRGLIANHTAVGKIVGTTSVSGELGLKVLYTLDTLTLNNVPAMSGVVRYTSYPPNNTLNPGITYIDYISMVNNYIVRFSGTVEASLNGMIWNPAHAPTGGPSGQIHAASGVMNIVPEYGLVISGYANIQVDYYPDAVASVSGLLPVSRLRIL